MDDWISTWVGGWMDTCMDRAMYLRRDGWMVDDGDTGHGDDNSDNGDGDCGCTMATNDHTHGHILIRDDTHCDVWLHDVLTKTQVSTPFSMPPDKKRVR